MPTVSEALAETEMLDPETVELVRGEVMAITGGIVSGGGVTPFVAVTVRSSLQPGFPARSRPLTCQVCVPEARFTTIGSPTVLVAAGLPSISSTALPGPDEPESSTK